jgi:4-hydroxy-tetrahydrodipicolinate synthase
MKFEGIYTALITPFLSNGGIDEKCFRFLIERQIEGGTHGLIIAGSTGEGLTMTESEWADAIKIAVEYKSKIHILGSCGMSGTQQTIEKYRKLADLGVDGALISTPAYNKPPQRGLVEHYARISESASLPIMVYNIPGRTAVNILPATMKEIWKLKNVVALKESSGNWEQFLTMMTDKVEYKHEAAVLVGEDAMNLAAFLSGAEGTVSVLSNIVPKATSLLWNLAKKANPNAARKLQADLLNLTNLIFVESNPIPTKWCLSQILKTDLKPRLPLVPLDRAHYEKLTAALDHIQKLELL